MHHALSSPCLKSSNVFLITSFIGMANVTRGMMEGRPMHESLMFPGKNMLAYHNLVVLSLVTPITPVGNLSTFAPFLGG